MALDRCLVPLSRDKLHRSGLSFFTCADGDQYSSSSKCPPLLLVLLALHKLTELRAVFTLLFIFSPCIFVRCSADRIVKSEKPMTLYGRICSFSSLLWYKQEIFFVLKIFFFITNSSPEKGLTSP